MSKNKTLLASGTALALSIMLVSGLSFASANEGTGDQEYTKRHFATSIDKEERLARKAEFFGITPEDLKERLDGGENLREIAESLGITKEDIEAHMKERATERVEQLYADGEIDEDRYNEIIERIESGDFKKKRLKHRLHHIKMHKDGATATLSAE